MRVKQSQGKRGSLKWIQKAINEKWPSLEEVIVQRLGSGDTITWLSPLAADDYAEYRDGSFLRLISQGGLEAALDEFWPARGPQWDALGETLRGNILLVEAKAHVAELCSPATAAGPDSRPRIQAALDKVAQQLNARPEHAPWSEFFYQLGNRLAHLRFLRDHGVPAWLVLVNFVGDNDIGGRTSKEAWEAAYQVAFHVMGLRADHPLAPFMIHVYPTVPSLT
jgi:hypothetical protein